MVDEDLFPTQEDDISLNGLGISEQQEFNALVYSVMSTPTGLLLKSQLEEMTQEQRWYPNEDASIGYYREGGSSMLRYLLDSYKTHELGN